MTVFTNGSLNVYKFVGKLLNVNHLKLFKFL